MKINKQNGTIIFALSLFFQMNMKAADEQFERELAETLRISKLEADEAAQALAAVEAYELEQARKISSEETGKYDVADEISPEEFQRLVAADEVRKKREVALSQTRASSGKQVDVVGLFRRLNVEAASSAAAAAVPARVVQQPSTAVPSLQVVASQQSLSPAPMAAVAPKRVSDVASGGSSAALVSDRPFGVEDLPVLDQMTYDNLVTMVGIDEADRYLNEKARKLGRTTKAIREVEDSYTYQSGQKEPDLYTVTLFPGTPEAIMYRFQESGKAFLAKNGLPGLKTKRAAIDYMEKNFVQRGFAAKK